MPTSAIQLDVILPAKESPLPLELDVPTAALLHACSRKAPGTMGEIVEEALCLGLGALLASGGGDL